MILLSFSSSVKYILSLMLAVLGYLPAEEILPAEPSNQLAPQNNEYVIVLDSLYSNDSLMIENYNIHSISYKKVHKLTELNIETISIPDHCEAIVLDNYSYKTVFKDSNK